MRVQPRDQRSSLALRLAQLGIRKESDLEVYGLGHCSSNTSKAGAMGPPGHWKWLKNKLLKIESKFVMCLLRSGTWGPGWRKGVTVAAGLAWEHLMCEMTLL